MMQNKSGKIFIGNGYFLKAVVAFIIALAFVLPGSAVFSNIGITTDRDIADIEMQIFDETTVIETSNDVDWWPMFHHDLENTGYSTSVAPDQYDILWSEMYVGVISSPAVMNGRVFFGGGSNMYCFNAADGSSIWDSDANGGVVSSPAVADGRVYFGSNYMFENVYCLDESDGSFIWGYATGNSVESSPAVVDGKVYVGSMDAKVYCLNAINGLHIWSYNTGSCITSSPAVADGKVYIGSQNGEVYCLNAINGSFIWSYSTDNKVDSSPCVSEGKVYIGSDDGNVYCLNAQNGSLIWSYLTGGWVRSSPAVAYGKIYIGSTDNSVYCLNASDGSLVWIYSANDKVWSSPVVADGKVFFQDSNICCLDAETGYLLWAQSTGWVRSSIAIADGSIFFGGSGGIFFCCGTDSIPPTTTHEFSGTLGNDNWYTSDVTITLPAEDRDPSGIEFTYYKLDDNVWQEYENPVIVSADGFHNISYYSVDYAGNEEPVKGPFNFKIDQTPPEIDLTVEEIESGKYKFTVDAVDNTSGMFMVEFYVDDYEYLGNDTEPPYEWIYSGTAEVARVLVYDNAGNYIAESEQSQSYILSQSQQFSTWFFTSKSTFAVLDQMKTQIDPFFR